MRSISSLYSVIPTFLSKGEPFSFEAKFYGRLEKYQKVFDQLEEAFTAAESSPSNGACIDAGRKRNHLQ